MRRATALVYVTNNNIFLTGAVLITEKHALGLAVIFRNYTQN